MDYECLHPFDELTTKGQPIIGYEPDHSHANRIEPTPTNALFAAPPNAKFLALAIQKIATVPAALNHQDVLVSTGPLMLKELFMQLGDQTPTIFPASVFSPLSSNSPKLKALKSNAPNAKLIKQELRKSGAYAIHYWANSWVSNLSGELHNPEPNSIKGFKFFQGLDSPGNDLFNQGRNITQLGETCRSNPKVVGFNTDGFAKSAIYSLEFLTPIRPNAGYNEGLYIKLPTE